jgi:murein DD-endopeptidase MepM/ murein hydrolase activator NlpD
MHDNISFFAINDAGSQVKSISISKRLLRTIICLFGVCFIAYSFIVFDYIRVKFRAAKVNTLENKIASQKEELSLHREQVKTFAHEINELKSKLVDLNSFEKKIRVIANIDTLQEENNLFGVGGSVPEDLNTDMDIEKKQAGLIRDMHEQVGLLYLASINQKNGFENIYNYLDDQRNLLSATPSIRPVESGWISSGFGYRKSPFTGRREFHKGLDIATRKGEPILAAADGTIIYAGKKGLFGNLMVIDHGNGTVTRYGHIDKFLKKHGDTVKRGDKIARVGSTGRSTGPHVHYEVRLNGIQVNPKKYILN